MSKSKTPKKPAARKAPIVSDTAHVKPVVPGAEAEAQVATTTPKKEPKAPKVKKEKTPAEELVVFAFRLTPEERDAIHKAAGPAKASKFVRALAVAAARNDEKLVATILKGVNQTES